jgi:SAM-dependent methyltransferase
MPTAEREVAPSAAPVCPACGDSSPAAAVESVPGYELLRCAACSLVFSDPMRSPGAAWYDEAYRLRHFAIDDRVRGYFRWTVREVLALSRPEAPVRRVLDVGCGEGVFVAYARRRGLEAFGLDFSGSAVAVGRAQFGNRWIHVGGFEALAPTGLPTSFDLITAFEVIEHVESPASFLAQVRERLAPGGLVAVCVPNRDGWPITQFNDYPPHHLTRWNLQTLGSFLERNGFIVERIALTSRLNSLNTFYCYLSRSLVYRLFGMHVKGLNLPPPASPPPTGASSLARRLLSLLRPRHVRDAVMWIPTLLTAPALIWWFKGCNVMAIARRRS